MAAFYKTKGWYKSKTVWAGLLTTGLAAASYFGFTPDVNAAAIVDAVFALLGVTAVYGRVTATEAINTPSTTV